MSSTKNSDTGKSERPDQAQQRQLLNMAVAAIHYGLEHHDIMPVSLDDYDGLLLKHRATFVTLKINNTLRGCIGTLTAQQPLIKDVVNNAYQAAFHDPRFEPLYPQELEQLHITISILSPPESMHVTSEQDLIDQLRPGQDGLIIEDDGHRATFLPSVWEQLPDPATFLQHLKHKAGVPADYWSDTINVERYGSIEFEEIVAKL